MCALLFALSVRHDGLSDWLKHFGNYSCHVHQTWPHVQVHLVNLTASSPAYCHSFVMIAVIC